MTLDKKNIFLLDGLGALVSFLFLGFVLPFFNDLIGLPDHILYSLAGCALFFAAYSLTCFRLANHKDPKWINAISIFNTLYCILSIVILIVYRDEIKTLGLIYFCFEKLIVFWVIFLERKIYVKLKKDW